MSKTYYKRGEWNLICDVCGRKIKSSESKHRWDGLIVCKDDWEPRHPQDFLRARQENTSVPYVRSEPADVNIAACTTATAIVGRAIAGCALVGYGDHSAFAPTGTFGDYS